MSSNLVFMFFPDLARMCSREANNLMKQAHFDFGI